MNAIRVRIALAALSATLFALSLAQPAGAFIRLTRQQTTPTLGPVVQAHWLNSTLPLLSVINATTPDLTYATALATVQTSAETWENVNTSYFTVNPVDVASGPYLPATLSAGDGQNSMFFDNAHANFAAGSGVIAFVRSVIDLTDGHTIDADMVFNDADFYTGIPPTPAGQTAIDLESVVTHEYGHYFGLDHTSIANSTMIPFIIAGTSQRSLELDDRAGLSTIYPAPEDGQCIPPGDDCFAATTGTISGTVISGFNGSAVFGAHVEAINLGAPTPENSISAISGELTLRNGMGDWTIHGLPPGTYAVRIVPLDGVHTIAADANVGGVFNGLDINFEVEFWNGAGESGDGFTDLAGSFVPVVVSAGGGVSGIAMITNTFPGQVEIAQYGQFENFVTGRAAAGFRAVRFDPPFDPPYTITKITFPTFTFGGVPGSFVSGRLCPMNASGFPDLTAPLFTVAPLPVSANGVNEVPINLTVTTPGQTFFWLLQNNARTGTPPNFPFLFMDFTNPERGLFGNSYDLNISGVGGFFLDRNMAVSMFCQMSSPGEAPIVAPRNLGANKRATKVEFDYDLPADVRADGFPMPQHSLDHVELIRRTPAYVTEGSGGAGTSQISLNTIPSGGQVWAAQAVDKNGNRSLQSNVTITGLGDDADEPNGRANEAAALTVPVVNRPETYTPAGDQDNYSLSAKPGDTIVASATATGQDGFNNLDLVMFVMDQTGEVVALDDDSGGSLNPSLSFTVPPPSNNSSGNGPRKFTILITDFEGSALNPSGAPQIITPAGTYRLDVAVTSGMRTLAGRLGGEGDEDGFMFRNGGPNPANPQSKLIYVLPRSVGAGIPVHLRIYDVSGRLVRTLVDGIQAAGPHVAIWDGKDSDGRGVGSGTYFARIEAGQWKHDARLSILK